MFKLFVSFCLVFSVASVSNGQSLTDLKKQSKTNLDLLAQRILGRGTGNAFLDLLKNDQVLVELRVDESQRTELYEGFREIIEVRDELTSLATENKSMSHEVVRLIKANDSLLLKIEEILDPIQIDRLIGIFCKQQQAMALCNPLVAKKLELTNSQRNQLSDIASVLRGI